jgi:hypothetical protein
MLLQTVRPVEELADGGMEVEPRAVIRYLCDREVFYSRILRDRIIVLNQEAKSGSSPTTALAMVIIALATLLGGGMTTWHYWNVEKRAAQSEHQAAMQRSMEWWKGEIQRAKSKQQQYKQLEEAQLQTASYAYRATVRTAAATELDMLSGPSTAAFSVP